MADDLAKDPPAILAPLVNVLPEFVPPAGARPRQSQPAELAEGLGVIVPAGTIAAYLFHVYAPTVPPEVQGASLVLGVVGLKFLFARARDWRWRGRVQDGA